MVGRKVCNNNTYIFYRRKWFSVFDVKDVVKYNVVHVDKFLLCLRVNRVAEDTDFVLYNTVFRFAVNCFGINIGNYL